MVDLSVVAAIAFAVLFFRAARYEGMNAWFWAGTSLGLAEIVGLTTPGMLPLFLVQLALFGAMWWHNMQRKKRKP
jgi:hypothetical protein